MEIETILALIREFLFLIVVFGALLGYAFVRGRRSLVCLILGLYIALLISLKFPYYEELFAFAARSGLSNTIFSIIIFVLFTGIGTILFERLLADDYEERAVEGMLKKVFLASLGTILVIAFSYHVLPVTSIIEPSASLNALFAPPEYFFWLLIVPLVGLLFV